MKTIRKPKNFINSLVLGNKAVLIVIVLAVAMALASPAFLTSRNVLNVLRQVCVNTVLACGFALVLGTGSIDLSVGGVVGITGIVMAKVMVDGMPIIAAIAIGIVVGVLIGVVNATLITVFNLTPFIATLGMMSILRGACYLVTKQKPITNIPESFSWIGQGYIGPIPFPVYLMVVVVIIVWVIANRTKFGRYLLAMGGNIDAARVSGINVVMVRYGVYMTMGVCATLASVVMCARASSAQPTGGLNMEMDAIAAAVIGGTSMSGGKVNVIGAFFGALIVGIVNNGLNLLGVDSSWQIVTRGTLILIAVILDSLSTMILAKVNRK